MPDLPLTIMIPEPNERYPDGILGCNTECPAWRSEENGTGQCGAGLMRVVPRMHRYGIKVPGPKCPQFKEDTSCPKKT